MLPPPPSSTLFPYTTLFRSLHIGAFFRVDSAGQDQRKKIGRFLDVLDRVDYLRSSTSRKDRKSTRLNSSHRCISYAVFCLKKKNKTHQFDSVSNEGYVQRIS